METQHKSKNCIKLIDRPFAEGSRDLQRCQSSRLKLRDEIILRGMLFLSTKMTGNRDAQSHAQIKIIANKTPPGLLLVGGTRCFGQAMDWFLLVVREYKFTIREPPIMCVAWKISRSLGCNVDNESIPLKILFISISKSSSGTSTNPCFPLRRAYLFTFMLSYHPLIKKH